MGLGRRPQVDLDVSAQARDVTEEQRVVGTRARRGQQRLGGSRSTARPGAARGREGELGATGPVLAQGRRAFVHRECGDIAAASLRPGAHRFQGVHHLSVRSECGGSQVPGLPVRIPPSGQRHREGPVDLPPLRPGRGLIDRRTHQRVPHRDRRSAPDEEPRAHRRLKVGFTQAQRCRSLPHHLELAGVVRGGQQQHRLDGGRQPPAAVEEDLLDVGRQG